MKKLFIVTLSLVIAATLTLNAVSSTSVRISENITLCDLDFERVCY